VKGVCESFLSERYLSNSSSVWVGESIDAQVAQKK
jgi:hypothetical protein